MSGQWTPTGDDLGKGRRPGFGATINIINGGLECGPGHDLPETRHRVDYYKYFCNFLHVSPGDHVGCADQQPFGQ